MADTVQIKSAVTDQQITKADSDSNIDAEDIQPMRNAIEESFLDNAHPQINQDETDINIEAYTEATLSKYSILKNLLVVSVSFVFLFSAFSSFQNLQSTINLDGSLGTIALCLLYFTYATSTLFIVTCTLSRFSFKRTMLVSMVTYILYVCTGFYSTWPTVIIASVLLGIGAAHLWVVHQAYVTELSRQYSQITKLKVHNTTDVFIGVFFGVFATSQIWGNLFSSFVLRPETVNRTEPLELCGVNFCPKQMNQSQLQQPSMNQMYMYTGFCVGLGCLAIAFTSIFLSNITVGAAASTSITTMLKSVSCHFATSRTQQLLIIPTLYRGMNSGFAVGDFTVAFVSCPLGVNYVGFVMMAYGTSFSMLSFAFGKLAKYAGHLPLFVVGFVAQFSAGMVLLLWQLDSKEPFIIFILASVWASGEAVYVSNLTALYSNHFKEDGNSAFSSLRLLAALGTAISFALSSAVCTKSKIITLLVMMSLSLLMLVMLRLSQKN